MFIANAEHFVSCVTKNQRVRFPSPGEVETNRRAESFGTAAAEPGEKLISRFLELTLDLKLSWGRLPNIPGSIFVRSNND